MKANVLERDRERERKKARKQESRQTLRLLKKHWPAGSRIKEGRSTVLSSTGKEKCEREKAGSSCTHSS